MPVVLRALLAADAPGTVDFLRAWSDREVYERPDDGSFFYATPVAGDLTLIDIDTGGQLREAHCGPGSTLN